MVHELHDRFLTQVVDFLMVKDSRTWPNNGLEKVEKKNSGFGTLIRTSSLIDRLQLCFYEVQVRNYFIHYIMSTNDNLWQVIWTDRSIEDRDLSLLITETNCLMDIIIFSSMTQMTQHDVRFYQIMKQEYCGLNNLNYICDSNMYLNYNSQSNLLQR